MNSLDALFRPRSVAVIGASNDTAKFGGRVFGFASDPGCRTVAYPVTPTQATIQGHPAFPSVSAIGAEIDLAVLAIPADAVIPALDDCAAASVRAAIVFSSGFAEAGTREGRERQCAMDAIRAASGMRILGPNCIGAVSAPVRLAATFATMWEEGWGPDSNIAVACQSGAFASYLYAMLERRGRGVRYWCSTGNECDIEVADCIAYACADDAVRVVLVCLEGVRDGGKLRAALALARQRGKLVVAIKVGTSAVGRLAAASHTATLAGEDRAMDALFQRYNVCRAGSFEAMIDIAVAASIGRLPRGRRLGLVTVSGGAGIMMADRAERLGMETPPLPEAVQRELAAVGPLAATRNPVDVSTGVARDPRQVVEPIRLVASQPGIDGVVAFLTSVFKAPARMDRLRAALGGLLDAVPDKPVFLSLFGEQADFNRLEAMGFPCFTDPVRAVDTMEALATWSLGRAGRPDEGLPVPVVRLPADPTDAALFGLLADAGIAMVPTRLAADAEEAAAAAAAAGYPVVVKLGTDDGLHKSDVGGVIAGVGSPADLAEACLRIRRAAAKLPDPSRFRGFLVQPMVEGVAEVIVAARHDPVLGPLVLFGLGGRLVELLDDVVVRLAPVGLEEASAMIDAIRGGAVLRGLRGGPRADIAFIAETIVQVSRLAAGLEGYRSFELNPVIVAGPGGGGLAVDARLERAEVPA